MTREPHIPMSLSELPQQPSQTQRHPSRPSPSTKHPLVSGAELAQLQKHWRGGFQTSLLACSPKQPDEGGAS
jgi:hypothetical protein